MDWMLLAYIGVGVFSAVFMEYVAWFTHKYVMHGFLWFLHEDHHRPHKGFFEKNDIFTLFFASVAMFLVIFGSANGYWFMMSAGIGMSVYGLGYFIFHDILFHKRIKVKHPKHPYLRRIINAHRTHHMGPKQQKDGKAYGFLWASKKYDEIKKTKESSKA
jgi:beta-carotene 3-hydroxylase